VTAIALGAPIWPDELTGIGTILLAIATFAAILTTVVITRQDRRIAESHLQRELNHSAAQLQDERDRAREHEQLVNAWAVRVYTAIATVGLDQPAGMKKLVVTLTNGGTYPISGLEVKFSPDGEQLIDAAAGYRGLPSSATFQVVATGPGVINYHDVVYGDTLTSGASAYFETALLDQDTLQDPCGVVRWRDNWDDIWESKKNTVRKIVGNEPWAP
jgi:hypothetical protein